MTSRDPFQCQSICEAIAKLCQICNYGLSIIFSVEFYLKKLIPNESHGAQAEFKKKPGQFLLAGISLKKGLPDLQLFSVRMTRCVYGNV